MRRDWAAARAKLEREGRCRSCSSRAALQAAHVIGRRHDEEEAGRLVVHPDDVVPLCQACHARYDAHALDLLPGLTLAEQARAVGHVGIISALRRTTSSR